MSNRKNILVCPLDWGLGHATRLVPVIALLLEKGHRVFIGADKQPLAFLHQRFPGCDTIIIPGYTVRYPKNGNMALAMLKSYPEMMKQAKKSKQVLEEIIKKEKIDVVISDNRYELNSEKAYCIFITHQLNIQTPGFTRFAKPFIQKKINGYIKKYNEVWIPDFEGENNLSGRLAHGIKFPVENFHFIGPISRFSLVTRKELSKTISLLILLSGPEPQRTVLEEMLIKQALETNLKTVVLQGKPGGTHKKQEKNVQIFPHLPDVEMADLMRSSEYIICRSGYSSIMDLAALGSKAILIPTPGQTEQEYLAKRFFEKNIYYTEKQINFNVSVAMERANNFVGLAIKYDNSALQKRIDSIK